MAGLPELGITPGKWKIVLGSNDGVYRSEEGYVLHTCNIVPKEPVNGVYVGNVCNFQSCDHIDGISFEETVKNSKAISLLPEMIDILTEVYFSQRTNSQIQSKIQALFQEISDV